MSDESTTKPSELPPPSLAYRQAIASPIYRLSELMFGSLLASYVLGFLTFAAAYSGAGSDFFPGETLQKWGQVFPFLDQIPQILIRSPFFFISITYAYVTAGMYVTYHAGILTMHHMPFEHLRYDFALALSQALIFGISMLHPMAFPFWLGITLLLATFRQHQEHKQLVKSFYRLLHSRSISQDPRTWAAIEKRMFRQFRDRYKSLLRSEKYFLLSGWSSFSMTLVICALALMAFISPIGWWLVKHGISKTYVLLVLSCITCLSVIIYTHIVLGSVLACYTAEWTRWTGNLESFL